MNEIICNRCGDAVPKTGTYQKYCRGCSEIRSLERKTAWAKANPQTRTPKTQAWEIANESLLRSRGSDRSFVQSKSMVDSLPVGGYPEDQSPTWYTRITVPYLQAVSKNYIFGLGGKGGHLYKRKESSDYRNAIALQMRSELRGRKIYQNKVWLDFFVQKPTHKSDAINVVDLLCDAIKDGIGVDDRWFCIRRLDWEIVKKDPQIYIGISQGPQFDAQACSYCGGIKPFDDFPLKKSSKNGRSRVCRVCSSIKSEIRAEVA